MNAAEDQRNEILIGHYKMRKALYGPEKFATVVDCATDSPVDHAQRKVCRNSFFAYEPLKARTSHL